MPQLADPTKFAGSIWVPFLCGLCAFVGLSYLREQTLFGAEGRPDALNSMVQWVCTEADGFGASDQAAFAAWLRQSLRENPRLDPRGNPRGNPPENIHSQPCGLQMAASAERLRQQLVARFGPERVAAVLRRVPELMTSLARGRLPTR